MTKENFIEFTIPQFNEELPDNWQDICEFLDNTTQANPEFEFDGDDSGLWVRDSSGTEHNFGPGDKVHINEKGEVA